jgi:hypothetical protein
VCKKSEIEIKLKEKALEYVAEYTYLRQLISFRDNSGKEIKMSVEIACYNFKSVRFMLTDKSKYLMMKKHVLKS